MLYEGKPILVRFSTAERAPTLSAKEAVSDLLSAFRFITASWVLRYTKVRFAAALRLEIPLSKEEGVFVGV
jgi:hypothetical protein